MPKLEEAPKATKRATGGRTSAAATKAAVQAATEEGDPKPKELETETLEESDDYLNSLWYGIGGTGKTTNLARMANNGRILFVNAEAGIKKGPLAKMGVETSNIVMWPKRGKPLTFEGLEDTYWKMKADLEDDPTSWYGTAWDSLTEIATKLLDEIAERALAKSLQTGKNRDRFFKEQGDWGEMTDEVRLLLRRFRDLPCHFAATALERRNIDDDGKVLYQPAVNPGLQSSLDLFFDLIAHTETEPVGEELEYWGAFRKMGKYHAKDRYNVMPNRLINPTFDRVLAYVGGDLDVDNDPDMQEARDRRTNLKEGDE